LDTELLALLMQIADGGSVQGLARRIGVSRSSLRRGLEALEAQVGVPLVHRDASGVRLTAAGSVLVERGRDVLESSRALLADVRAAHGEAAGTIRIFQPVGMPLALRTQGVLAIRATTPHLKIVERHFEDPLAHAHEPFELMLHEGPAPHQQTWFSRVRVPLRAVASMAYLEQRGTPRDLEALESHDVLGWQRPGTSTSEWPLLAGGVASVSPWLSSPDPLFLFHLASSGGGIVLAPQPLFDEPAAQPLVPVLADLVGTEVVFRISSPLPSRSDSRTRDVVAQILALLEDLPRD
jgi:DNA-binding transcriptional LysR family regulator